ncbi:hypothetical protein TNCV_2571481 [Trichonephila clavipes]|nr:hypothetical protein TNCV_2571481 [Trichonephila clavipes]
MALLAYTRYQIHLRHFSYRLISFEKLGALYTEEEFNDLFDFKHCFQSAFRRDSSSKPETDESHLVRDKDCMAEGVGAPNQELLDGFAWPSPSVVSNGHPTTECQI